MLDFVGHSEYMNPPPPPQPVQQRQHNTTPKKKTRPSQNPFSHCNVLPHPPAPLRLLSPPPPPTPFTPPLFFFFNPPPNISFRHHLLPPPDPAHLSGVSCVTLPISEARKNRSPQKKQIILAATQITSFRTSADAVSSLFNKISNQISI